MSNQRTALIVQSEDHSMSNQRTTLHVQPEDNIPCPIRGQLPCPIRKSPHFQSEQHLMSIHPASHVQSDESTSCPIKGQHIMSNQRTALYVQSEDRTLCPIRGQFYICNFDIHFPNYMINSDLALFEIPKYLLPVIIFITLSCHCYY